EVRISTQSVVCSWRSIRVRSSSSAPSATGSATTAARRSIAACATTTAAARAATTAGSLSILTGFPCCEIRVEGGTFELRAVERNVLVDGPDERVLSRFPVHHFRGFHHPAVACDRQFVVVVVHVDIVVRFLIEVGDVIKVNAF